MQCLPSAASSRSQRDALSVEQQRVLRKMCGNVRGQCALWALPLLMLHLGEVTGLMSMGPCFGRPTHVVSHMGSLRRLMRQGIPCKSALPGLCPSTLSKRNAAQACSPLSLHALSWPCGMTRPGAATAARPLQAEQ